MSDEFKLKSTQIIRDAIPLSDVIDLIRKGMEAEKTISTRIEGIVTFPDWDSRVKFATLRVRLGGELEEELPAEDQGKLIQIVLNKKRGKKNE